MKKKLVLSFLISSLVIPLLGIATEEIVLFTPGTHTRTLAASCAACHGTNGNSVVGNSSLAGMDKIYFVRQMLAFKSGDRIATVMHHHAKGLNEAEITQLADYFAAQKIVKSAAPAPQPLSKNHE